MHTRVHESNLSASCLQQFSNIREIYPETRENASLQQKQQVIHTAPAATHDLSGEIGIFLGLQKAIQ